VTLAELRSLESRGELPERAEEVRESAETNLREIGEALKAKPLPLLSI